MPTSTNPETLDTNAELLRDLAAVDAKQLAEHVMESTTSNGERVIIPDVHTNDPALLEFHARLQRVQELPQYQPAVVLRTLKTGLVNEHFDPTYERLTADQAINKRKSPLFRGGTLDELGLDKVAQLLLARATIIATESRISNALENDTTPSNNQVKLQKRAVELVNHFRTNPVSINGDTDKFMGAYATAFLARAIYYEILELPRGTTASIETAMAIPIPFSILTCTQSDQLEQIFSEGSVGRLSEDGQATTFTLQHPSLIDPERTEILNEIRARMSTPDTTFRFFDTIHPFSSHANQETREATTPSISTGGRASKPIETKAGTDEQYVVLQIQQTNPGGTSTHVVAEHNAYKHACYVLREEVLEEWENLIGIRFTWRELLAPKRMIVRQLGARAFYHTDRSNVPEKVVNYLHLNPQTVVIDAFGKIFDASAGLFDDDMDPTPKNIMPKMLIAAIKKSPTMQELWPLIRELGYGGSYRTLHGIERAAANKAASEKSPETPPSLIDRAEEIMRLASFPDLDD